MVIKVCIGLCLYAFNKEMGDRLTSGLASCGVSARGKFSRNLKVCRPSELLCSPARPPSRQPMSASLVDNAVKNGEAESQKWRHIFKINFYVKVH